MFADGLIQPLAIKDSPFRMRLSQSDSWGGQEVHSVPMRYSLPSARSRNAALAINERYNSNVGMAQWIMRPGYDYATFRVQYGDILRAREDSMAYGRLQQVALTSTIEALNKSINQTIWRDTTGYIAQVATTSTSTAAGGTTLPNSAKGALVLTNVADANLFDNGMQLQFFNTTSSNVPVLLNGGATVGVLAVDAESGYVYIDTLPTNITGIATNTFVIQAGDGVGFGPTVENGAIAGVANYIPLVLPVPGNTLWNQDQSLHPQKLGGWRKDARGLNVLEEVQRMMARIVKYRGPGEFDVYMAPEQLQNIIIGRDALTENFREVKTFVGPDGMGGEIRQEVGYTGVRVLSPSGVANLFAEPYMPADRVYVLSMNTWHLSTMGQFPHLVQMGTMNGLIAESDDFALQGRLFAAGQFWCDAPLFNGVLQVTPIF
jgi:hypothetical protein